MVGGNLAGVTRTVSVSIYDSVQALNYQAAWETSLLLLVVSFAILSVHLRTAEERLGGMADDLIVDIEKRFPSGAVVAAALRSSARGGTTLVLFGPSGAGKTTVVRCIAGLERPDRGHVRFAGETWFDADRATIRRAASRGVGYVGQNSALFPHLTVRDNVGTG